MNDRSPDPAYRKISYDPCKPGAPPAWRRGFFMEGKENLGQVTVLVIVCVGVWVKIKMFSVVKAKASNLF